VKIQAPYILYLLLEGLC